MLPTYSSPQCWEPRQDYPCFTNQVAGTGEVKPAFLRATDPGRVRAQLRSKDWGQGCTIAAQFCQPLNLAQVRAHGPSFGLMGWVICSQRPGLTLQNLTEWLECERHSVNVCWLTVLSVPKTSLWCIAASWWLPWPLLGLFGNLFAGEFRKEGKKEYIDIGTMRQRERELQIPTHF